MRGAKRFLLTGLTRARRCRGLGNNRFVSSIPTEVGHLTNLVILWLDRNLLVGTAPTQIGRLTALTELSLWNNALGGALPTSFSLLTALKYLCVAGFFFVSCLTEPAGRTATSATRGSLESSSRAPRSVTPAS